VIRRRRSYHAVQEASFEAKETDKGCNDLGSGRTIFSGGRHFRRNLGSSREYNDEERRTGHKPQ